MYTPQKLLEAAGRTCRSPANLADFLATDIQWVMGRVLMDSGRYQSKGLHRPLSSCLSEHRQAFVSKFSLGTHLLFGSLLRSVIRD
mmetsp:Transcript_10731/g.16830  ORF Transcript_10731/g.16830 Transcript_10731/m.16830 type:complete len:86 (-) Transcript_10731:279-536(-)